MSTVITFTGADGQSALSILVAESADAVHDAMNAAHGQPFRLESEKTGVPVYVNPANIAYWRERQERTRTASFH
jgi:hypothetical protein